MRGSPPGIEGGCRLIGLDLVDGNLDYEGNREAILAALELIRAGVRCVTGDWVQ